MVLPDLHAVLDVTEYVMFENLEEKESDKLQMQLYRPDPGDESGFDEEESADSFDAFEAALKADQSDIP